MLNQAPADAVWPIQHSSQAPTPPTFLKLVPPWTTFGELLVHLCPVLKQFRTPPV